MKFVEGTMPNPDWFCMSMAAGDLLKTTQIQGGIHIQPRALTTPYLAIIHAVLWLRILPSFHEPYPPPKFAISAQGPVWKSLHTGTTVDQHPAANLYHARSTNPGQSVQFTTAIAPCEATVPPSSPAKLCDRRKHAVLGSSQQ